MQKKNRNFQNFKLVVPLKFDTLSIFKKISLHSLKTELL